MSCLADPEVREIANRLDLGPNRFECVQVFNLRVPDGHVHRGAIGRFKNEKGDMFAHWNRRVCDRRYGEAEELLPGQVLSVSLFKARAGAPLHPKNLQYFFDQAGAIYCGVHGLILIHESPEWVKIPLGVKLVAPMKRVRRTHEEETRLPALRRGQDGKSNFIRVCPFTLFDESMRFPLFRLV